MGVGGGKVRRWLRFHQRGAGRSPAKKILAPKVLYSVNHKIRRTPRGRMLFKPYLVVQVLFNSYFVVLLFIEQQNNKSMG